MTGKARGPRAYARDVTRRIQVIMLFILSTAAFVTSLIALFSTSWRISEINVRPSLPGLQGDTLFRKIAQHGIWSVCDYFEKTEMSALTPDLQIRHKCYPYESKFPDQVSYFARSLFVICAITQGCLFLVLSGSLIFCCYDVRGIRCYFEDSMVIQLVLFCVNSFNLFGQIVAAALFLGKSPEYYADGKVFSFYVTSKSLGAICCSATIFVTLLADFLIGYMIKFESSIQDSRALNLKIPEPQPVEDHLITLDVSLDKKKPVKDPVKPQPLIIAEPYYQTVDWPNNQLKDFGKASSLNANVHGFRKFKPPKAPDLSRLPTRVRDSREMESDKPLLDKTDNINSDRPVNEYQNVENHRLNDSGNGGSVSKIYSTRNVKQHKRNSKSKIDTDSPIRNSFDVEKQNTRLNGSGNDSSAAKVYITRDVEQEDSGNRGSVAKAESVKRHEARSNRPYNSTQDVEQHKTHSKESKELENIGTDYSGQENNDVEKQYENLSHSKNVAKVNSTKDVQEQETYLVPCRKGFSFSDTDSMAKKSQEVTKVNSIRNVKWQETYSDGSYKSSSDSSVENSSGLEKQKARFVSRLNSKTSSNQDAQTVKTENSNPSELDLSAFCSRDMEKSKAPISVSDLDSSVDSGHSMYVEGPSTCFEESDKSESYSKTASIRDVKQQKTHSKWSKLASEVPNNCDAKPNEAPLNVNLASEVHNMSEVDKPVDLVDDSHDVEKEERHVNFSGLDKTVYFDSNKQLSGDSDDQDDGLYDWDSTETLHGSDGAPSDPETSKLEKVTYVTKQEELSQEDVTETQDTEVVRFGEFPIQQLEELPDLSEDCSTDLELDLMNFETDEQEAEEDSKGSETEDKPSIDLIDL